MILINLKLCWLHQLQQRQAKAKWEFRRNGKHARAGSSMIVVYNSYYVGRLSCVCSCKRWQCENLNVQNFAFIIFSFHIIFMTHTRARSRINILVDFRSLHAFIRIEKIWGDLFFFVVRSFVCTRSTWSVNMGTGCCRNVCITTCLNEEKR